MAERGGKPASEVGPPVTVPSGAARGSLRDRLAVPVQPDARRLRTTHPQGFEPGVRFEGGAPAEVTLQLREIPEDEQRWREEITRVTSLPIPDHRKVELSQVRYWGDPGAPFIYCRFTIADREVDPERLDLDELVALARKARKHQPKTTSTEQALVVSWADLQVGKAGSRGGTAELVDRVMEKLDALDAHAKRVKAHTAYLIDVGDCVESFENVAAQGFTNDLSFPEQLRVARRLYTEAALLLAKRHERVVCASVPSNHGRWRRGKDQLGRPGDDYGIETLVAVHDAFALNPDALGHVSFVVPEVWQETIALDVCGTIVAVAHGHQVNRPEQVPVWWAKQVHGGQPAADADVLLTGHFHHVRVQPTGRSAHTGRAKWWLQAPTLDNASDHVRLRQGDDSDPALMVFTVTADGWDDLKLL